MAKGGSKGLEYEASEPAFLRKLREQHGGGDGRHERPVPRPRKARTAADEDDDAPAYVMEDSNDSLSKEDYTKLLASEGKPISGVSADTAQVDDNEGDNDESIGISGRLAGSAPTASGAIVEDRNNVSQTEPRAQRIAEAGRSSKKRKVAKAVGSDEADDKVKQNGATECAQSIPNKKAKKKAKPIKLAFNDDVQD